MLCTIEQVGKSQGILRSQFGLYTFSKLNATREVTQYKVGQEVEATFMYQEQFQDYQLVAVK